jgi:hypothetical protein
MRPSARPFNCRKPTSEDESEPTSVEMTEWGQFPSGRLVQNAFDKSRRMAGSLKTTGVVFDDPGFDNLGS